MQVSPTFRLMVTSCFLGLLILASGVPAPAQAPPVREPLSKANTTQKEVLSELARILNEEKVRLSDGAIQNALLALLNDEKEQLESIRSLGRRTLGKSPEELTEAENAERSEMADNQQVYADRFGRLEKSIEAKAAARPDSVFSKVLLTANDADLDSEMEAAVEQLRANQLGNALRTVTGIVDALSEMVESIGDDAGEDADDNGNGPNDSFALPSLWVKGPDQTLTQFNWSGATPDAMGSLLKALRVIDELVKQQKRVAKATKERAPTDETAFDLAEQEWEIRYRALETASELALLDPKIEDLLRTASRSIEAAVPGMEQGPLRQAVEPAERAAVELEEASAYLHAVWEEILEFIKGYTQDLEPLIGGAMSVPHGMSQQEKDSLERMIFSQMRATRNLAAAVEDQAALMESTAGTGSEGDLASLGPEQQAIRSHVEEEVIPYNVDLGQLPPNLRSKESVNELDAPVLLNDAFERMEEAQTALAASDQERALAAEEAAQVFMGDALVVMTDILARLLGQYSPPGMAPFSGAQAGMALDPAGGEVSGVGWEFELTDEMRETIRQAFRGEFPERYDTAIKTYYEAIASEGRGQ